MRTLLAVMGAGALGAACRYGLEGMVANRVSGQMPWGTLAVNVSGCLVIGFLSTLLTDRFAIDPALRVGLTVGFVGSYTTFSTLLLESTQLAQDGSVAVAAFNVALSLVLGFIAVLAGAAIGRVL